MKIPNQQIRAAYNDKTIRVYQAYNKDIASSALRNNTFVSPIFKTERMTWIKPSFLWMMYRSGWGLKDKDQNHILAIDITREGFQWALEHSCPSHCDNSMDKEEWNNLKEKSPVRIQWDPERDLLLKPLEYRTIQVGLSKEAIKLYINEWIQEITDVTSLAHSIHNLTINSNFHEAELLLPNEFPINHHW
jgi:Domain of unknown function (DUF4291)